METKKQKNSFKPQQKTTAYAWASGLIGFGPSFPDGALPIANGPDARVREVVEIHARHGIRNDMYVPGMSAAEDQEEGMLALVRFVKTINEGLKEA